VVDAPERIWAAGTDHGSGNSAGTWFAKDEVGVEYVRADLYARLQEEVETLRKERDANHHMAVANGQRAKDEHYRAESAEAREDTLQALLEDRDKFIVDQGLWATFVASLPAAVQKEPRS
jgi:hypothetical protein